MASAPAEPVRGVVDAEGRLTAADPLLARLQQEAGSDLGAPVAVPQLAMIVRLARKLGVTISRPALAATNENDLDLWVRAEPQDGDVQLTIESWVERIPQRPRWPGRNGESLERPRQTDEVQTDSQLRISAISEPLARLLGTSPERAVGLPLTRLLQLEPDANGDMPLLTGLAQRRGFAGQKAFARRGGSALLLAGDVLAGANDFSGFRIDATTVQAASPGNVQAAEAFHELLQLPLDTIVSEAERIARKADGPIRSDYAGYANDITAAARHLLDVLRSLGREATAPEEDKVDLAALALEAAGLVQAQASEAGVTMELEGETSLAAAGQPRAVTQILVNLIGNAVRHSPPGGAVRITARRDKQAAVVVEDQGPGVAEADRERIFEPFEQGRPSGGGAGLGLAISRRLARSMGGDILLDSADGGGARFTLTLPLA